MRYGAFIFVILNLLLVNLTITSATEIKFGENVAGFKIIDYENEVFYMYGTDKGGYITENETIKEDILNGEDIIISQTLEGDFTYHYLPNFNNSNSVRDFKIWKDTIWVLIDETDGINRYITTYNMTSNSVEINLAKLSPTRNENGYGFTDFDIEVTADNIYTYCAVDGEHICTYDKETLELLSAVKYLPEGVPDGKDNTRTISIEGDQLWTFHKGSRISSSYGRSTDHPGIFLKVNITSGERQMLLEIDPYDDWKEEYGNIEDIVYEENTVYVLWDKGYLTSYSTDSAVITSEPTNFSFNYFWVFVPIVVRWIRKRKVMLSFP